MAARDLQVEDAAVLRSVASRAEQVALSSATPEQREPLMRVAEVLRTTADTGGSPTEATSTTRPSPEEPSSGASAHQSPLTTGPSGPRVTTQGIPPAEMLREDELNQPDPLTDPRSADYPGTGVPVRDSLNGPRGAAPEDRTAGASPFPPGPPMPGPAQPMPLREPSTNELYYGVGSDRHAQYDPHSTETREDDKNIMRNWGIVFLVIIVIICLLVMVL